MNAVLLLFINTLATWYMVGLIWMVQVVHYKMFDRVGADVFARYAIDHSRLITPIVGIPMLIEMGTALAMVFVPIPGIARIHMVVGLILLVGIWLSTATLQVPCHEQLANGFDPAVYQRLVSTNWIRTILWSMRGILLGFLLWQLIRDHAAG